MTSPVVTYTADDGVQVRFEIEPTDDWYEVSAETAMGRIREAVAPALEGAQEVLRSVRAIAPDEIEVKFGIKVSGTMNWLVAKSAGEGNFEVTLTWKSRDSAADS